jgi:hypothetical protein
MSSKSSNNPKNAEDLKAPAANSQAKGITSNSKSKANEKANAKGAHWHHGGTTDKVAAQTGAAKDESFTFDNADTLILEVLANDPGSAKLWSIDQDALSGPDSAHVDPYLDSVTLASGATLSVNPDGSVNYTPPADITNLPEGEIWTDSFSYVIRMANGALSSAQAEVNIVGTAAVDDTPGKLWILDDQQLVREDGEYQALLDYLSLDPDAIVGIGGTYDVASDSWIADPDGPRFTELDVIYYGDLVYQDFFEELALGGDPNIDDTLVLFEYGGINIQVVLIDFVGLKPETQLQAGTPPPPDPI